jgi:hypothetical protein
MGTQEPENASGSAKKPRGKPFEKGNTIGARGRAGKPPVYADASLLEDMRHVRAHPKSEDKTEGQKDCRQWKQQNFREFMSRLSALEEAEFKLLEAEAKVRKPAEERPETDEGTERAIQTCEEWLENYADQHPEAYQ